MKPIRVGIIGYEIGRSWAAVAHVPALKALPDYEPVAVATTRRESADAAARDMGVELAFDDPYALIAHPDIDLVAVTVKVPAHYALVEAAIRAGKHVFCEWPLGNGQAEAEAMAKMARDANVRAVVGLQARMAPAICQVRKLLAEGYVGEVLSTSLIASAMQWGDNVDRPNAYIVDKSHGATMLTIPMGHTVDALCNLLGEFRSVSATTAIRQPIVTRTDTGEQLSKTAWDQVAISGELAGGAIASVHFRGGVSRGAKLLWEINGSEGDLQLTADGGHAQIFDLSLSGGRGDDRGLSPINIDSECHWAPAALAGPPVNVAQLYARFAADLRNGTKTCPDFDDAVTRHKLVTQIEQSAAEGRKVTA